MIVRTAFKPSDTRRERGVKVNPLQPELDVTSALQVSSYGVKRLERQS